MSRNRSPLTQSLDTASERRIFRWFLAGRLGVIGAALLAILVLYAAWGATGDILWVVALLALDAALTGPYLWTSQLPGRDLRALTSRILLSEILLVTVGIYFLGATSAIYGLPLYSMLVITSAALHSARAAYKTAALSTVAYGALALVMGFGWIPIRPGAFPIAFAEVWPWTTALINATTCGAMAIVGGLLSDATREALLRSRALEAELRDANRQLEDRVESAVHGMRSANASLTAKNAELERTLRQVELFGRAVSHDLRNPLTAARESFRVARDRGEPQRGRMLALVEENLERADRMLLGLRDLMRAVGSRREVETVHVRSLLEEVVGELRAAREGAEPPVAIRCEPGTVQARREELTHVFRNLIANALEHNAGQSDLRVEVGREGTGEDEAAFFVRDNGGGIPYELQPHIFEPFRRGSTQGEGLGLGLALVEAIVAHAGGKIWLDSAPGRGTVFRFTVPTAGEEE